MDFTSHRSGEGCGIRRGSQYQKHLITGLLLIRKIRHDLAIGIEPVLFHCSDHADNRHRLLGIEPEVFADWIVMGPEALPEPIVDNYRSLRVGRIVIVE